MKKLLADARRAFLGSLYPPQCLGCDTHLSTEAGALHAVEQAPQCERAWFCAECVPRLTPLSSPCPVCAESRPAFVDMPPPNGPCRRCREPRDFVRAQALWEHRGPAAHAVRTLKEHGYRDSAFGLGTLLSRVVADFEDVEALVPVPLTAEKRATRGFNQAELVAKHLGERLGLPVLDLARRVEAVGSQKGADKAARDRNVDGVFQSVASPPMRVLIVDDVITTGATASSLARTLSDSGHKIVGVVALTRA